MLRGILNQPDKVLAQIFQEHVEQSDGDISCTSDGPWLLSHVCRLWRETVLDHPELWSIVSVVEPETYVSNSYLGDLLLLLNLALGRSRNHPLEVKLEFNNAGEHTRAVMRSMGVEDGRTILLHRLISAVVAHSNRWKKADLNIAPVFIPLFAPIRNRLSLLTEFTPTVGDSTAPFPHTQNAPSLTEVTLMEYSHEIVSVPWSSIRKFSETQMTPRRASLKVVDRFLKLLRENPNLQALAASYPSAQLSQSSLTHRSLRRLNIDEGSLIRCLTLPLLEQLTAPADGDTAAAIRGLITRSKCSLRHLWLTDFTLNEDVLVILSSSSKLHTLVLRATGWNKKVKKTMDLLIKKLADPAFLPALEDLDIEIHRTDEYDPAPMPRPCQISFINDAFVEMLAGRWERRLTAKGGAYLKKAFVLVELPSTVGLSRTRGVARLQKLCDEGLDVFVSARDPRGLDLQEHAKNISYVYQGT
ncbi:hypothetical protein C8R46DRAFT_1193798 [Mycena filopes]|nr:hypothetical protein C8R46DRAFT_1193798 [Mycena filopes]